MTPECRINLIIEVPWSLWYVVVSLSILDEFGIKMYVMVDFKQIKKKAQMQMDHSLVLKWKTPFEKQLLQTEKLTEKRKSDWLEGRKNFNTKIKGN